LSELNPQISKQLRVLETSQELVTGALFFRKGYPKAQQDEFIKEVTHVHNKTYGQQVLTVFQTERLEEHPKSLLNGTIMLMDTYRRLIENNNASSGSDTTRLKK
jgi:hypothetical protein